MKSIYLLIIGMIGITNISIGQSITPNIVNTAGGEVQTSWGSLDFSIGEVAIETVENTNSIITQGVLQPYFFFVNTDEKISMESIKIYPNPTSNYLNIDFENGSIEEILIHDVVGKRVENYSFNNNIIDFSNLPQGCYVLTFLFNRKYHSFTIVKI